MDRMNTAEAVVAMLKRNGIDTIFCLPGVQNDVFFDALYDNTNVIRPVHTRHEQACAYMALGAAMATGRPAAYAVVPGPGFLNTTAALATAYACNAPVLAIVGQIPLGLIGRNLGLLHEIPDQMGVMRSLTKWSARISAPAEAPAMVNDAFRHLLSGRQRPVGLECPMDVWGRAAPVALPEAGAHADVTPVDEDAIEAAAKLLGAAERPLLVVGGGAQDASAEVRAIAEMLQAPVLAMRMGRGVLDGRHPLSVTTMAGHHLWGQADVVLAVGTRLQTQLMTWGVDDNLKIVRIDADPEELDRQRRPTIGIIGDAASTLRSLADRLGRHNRQRGSRSEETVNLSAKYAAAYGALQPQLAYLDAIRAALPEDGIFVDELTQIGYAARLAFPVYRPRTFLTAGYQGTLGWGYATALGAKVAKPDTPVLSISGDGGFMFTVQEMATARQNNIGLVAVVFNDGAYGNVKRIQQQSYKNRTIATDLRNPDFVKLAKAFDIEGLRAESPDALRKCIEQAFKSGAPTVIDVPVGPMPDPWRFLMPSRNRPPRASK
jgi:acetolactate synthase-1/2/3 large subunit